MAASILSLYRIFFPNGKSYFGITSNPKNRLRQHKQNARNGVDFPLYRALRKYGTEAVRFEVLVRGSPKYIQELEISAIRHFRTDKEDGGYNLHPGGTLSPMENPAVIAKVSAALKGRSPSEVAVTNSLAARLGKKHTPEHKEKIGAALRGRAPSTEARMNMSLAQRGLKKSRGWWSTPEGREKHKQNNHGNRKPRSAELKQKLREAALLQFADPEKRARHLAACASPTPVSEETRMILAEKSRDSWKREKETGVNRFAKGEA